MRHFGLVPQGTVRGDNGDRSFLDRMVRSGGKPATVEVHGASDTSVAEKVKQQVAKTMCGETEKVTVTYGKIAD